MLKSQNIISSDFESKWYKSWAKKLQQTESGKGNFMLRSNKFWQNAIMAQIIYDENILRTGMHCIGFGVGKERLPALFASYGVAVSATDQDFTKQRAQEWNNDQLAHGAFSLNEDGICDPKIFKANVSFSALDMTKIPKKYNDTYDFLWSNCALGHLGSINKSLNFIEQSLACLKPGGLAVHTTELNIISDTETAMSGNTVIFRISDIYKLCDDLVSKGYICSPFRLDPSQRPADQHISLNPQWGTDHTKILVEGHLATQIVLVIKRPVKKLSRSKIALEKVKHKYAYALNKAAIKKIRSTNRTVGLLLKTQLVGLESLRITPLKRTVRVTSKSTTPIILEFRNDSAISLTGVNSIFNAKPLVIGTENPINRESKLANEHWFTPNRPSAVLLKKIDSKWRAVDYVEPGEKFGFEISVNSNKRIVGAEEDFTLIQETGGVVPNSTVTLSFR